MSQDKVETIRSSSSGVLGRARNAARGVTVAFDSSSRPQADAITNSEAFLAAVSSCGVTLIEMHAKETDVPLAGMDVTIEGTRTAAEPNRFARVSMSFELAGAMLRGEGTALEPGLYAFVDGNHLGGVGVVLVERTADGEPEIVEALGLTVHQVFAGAGLPSLSTPRAITAALNRLRNVLD